jgi:peptide/nickel transport system permease protein
MATANLPPLDTALETDPMQDSGVSSFRKFWRRFSRHRLALVGLGILVFLILVSIFAPLLTPYSPTAPNLAHVLLPPSAAHPLGTDALGRDVLARLMYGGRVSFMVGFFSMIIATSIGVVWGATSGYLGGIWDTLMMRFVDLVMSFPAIFLLLVVLNLTGANASVGLMILYLGLFGWTGLSRIVRSQVLSLRSQEYVEAARAQGASNARILFKHVLPGAMAPVWVSAAFGVAGSMLAEASLDFLGFGLQPQIPSWGNMLDSAESYIVTHPLLILAPGLVITIAVVAINFVGDALRDALDPRSTAGMQRIG